MDNFRMETVPAASPAEGEVLVRHRFVSVDPYMRPRLTADQPLDAPMLGGGIGRIVQSRNPRFKEGDLVRHGAGMQERFNSDGKGLQVLTPDPALSLSVYMHALGGTGITAYGGLLETGALKDGEQVFVSTAGGAVGSVVAQIAKIKGCYVGGSTGADDKAAWLRDEVGLDAVINYKTTPLTKVLREAMPKGIDVYFDNVGGEMLDLALTLMNVFGRIVACGMISTYNDLSAAGPRNIAQVVIKRLRMEGFVILDPQHDAKEAYEHLLKWAAEGRLQHRAHILEGLECVPDAINMLLEGRNQGKLLVRVGQEP